MRKVNGINLLPLLHAGCICFDGRKSISLMTLESSSMGGHPGVPAPMCLLHSAPRKTNATVSLQSSARAKPRLWSGFIVGSPAPQGCLGVHILLPAQLTQPQGSCHGTRERKASAPWPPTTSSLTRLGPSALAWQMGPREGAIRLGAKREPKCALWLPQGMCGTTRSR